jgi:hypothetical protein
MIITLYESANYNSCIDINRSNRNFNQLEKINDFLLQESLTWSWLIKSTGIKLRIYKTYFSDEAKISLHSIELISVALLGIIKTPREIMNPLLPSLNNGVFFKLNLIEICKKYNVSNGELVLNCHLDKGVISLIKRGQAIRLRAETLTGIFNYFKKISIPLNTPLDLIYFPYWDESPLHFIPNTAVNHLFVRRNYLVKFP